MKSTSICQNYWLRGLAGLVSIAFLLSLSAHATDLHFLTEGHPDATALLTPPPQPDSPEQKADLETVRMVSREAPASDVTNALAENKFTAFNFSSVIGDFFQPGRFPKTEAFLQNVLEDAKNMTGRAKDFYHRPRPYVIDPTLANGKLEKSFGYPSGHSTETMVLALVLAEVFPDKHDAIIAHARQMGWHRVEIARHYPTDIYAGRVLAQAIVREMDRNPSFQKALAESRAELANTTK